MSLQESILKSLIECKEHLNSLISNTNTHQQISLAVNLMAQKIKAGGKIISAGNGGSMCDAMHFAEELTGKFRQERPPIPALAISDPGYLTCVGNDYGYCHTFLRFIQAHCGCNDVFVAISTSGKSPNIIAAIEQAKKQKATIVTLTGQLQSPAGKLADIDICTCAGAFSDRVQELHIKVLHIMVELLEKELRY